MQYLVMLLEAVPDLKQERTVQIAASDLVVVEGKVHGTLEARARLSA